MHEKYLEFAIADKNFAYPIERIVEIIEYPHVEPLTNTPSSVLGVMNLRGKLVVVFDVASCLSEESLPITSKTCVIVTEVRYQQQGYVIASKVDMVRQVVDVAMDELEQVPDLGGCLKSSIIKGVAKLDQRMLTILDVDRLLSATQWSCVLNTSTEEGADG